MEEAARQRAEYEAYQAAEAAKQAAEAAKPWIKREGNRTVVAMLSIAFVVAAGVIWLTVTNAVQSSTPTSGNKADVTNAVQSSTPTSGNKAATSTSENQPATLTWAKAERSKVPKSVWDKKVVWAVQHHCYFAAMSRDEIVQAVGEPAFERPSRLIYKRPTDCVRYEVNGNACAAYNFDQQVIFLAEGYEDEKANVSAHNGCRTLYGEHSYIGLPMPNFER